MAVSEGLYLDHLRTYKLTRVCKEVSQDRRELEESTGPRGSEVPQGGVAAPHLAHDERDQY